MSVIKTIKEWIATYPKYNLVSDLQVDFFDQTPSNGSIAPAGLLEISRKEDNLGFVYLENQYNFGLYFVFLKPPGDNEEAESNADWVIEFQEWVQEQSIRRKIPKIGDKTISIKAENGTLYYADEEGTGVYMVQLTINYQKTIDLSILSILK